MIDVQAAFLAAQADTVDVGLQLMPDMSKEQKKNIRNLIKFTFQRGVDFGQSIEELRRV
jgi:hypothetical protein